MLFDFKKQQKQEREKNEMRMCQKIVSKTLKP